VGCIKGTNAKLTMICPLCGADLFESETILIDGSLGCRCRLESSDWMTEDTTEREATGAPIVQHRTRGGKGVVGRLIEEESDE